MNFLDRLIAWLELLPRAEEVPADLAERIDLPARRQTLDEALDTFFRDEASTAQETNWLRPNFLEDFAGHLGLQGTSDAADDVRKIIDVAIVSIILGVTISDLWKGHPRKWIRGIEKWTSNALSVAEGVQGTAEEWDCLGRYAMELRLADRSPIVWARSTLGDVLLNLKGSDRIRWLMHLEVLQSVGNRDPWRVHRSVLEHIRLVPHDSGAGDEFTYPGPEYAMRRWHALGVWKVWADRDSYEVGYVVGLPAPLLDEVLSGEPTPMGVFAQAMVGDHRAEVLGSLGVTARADDRAAEAALEYAKMVKHELGNALIPLAQAIEDAFEALEETSAGPKLNKHKKRILQKLDRITEFSREQMEIARLAASPPEPMRLQDVVLGAIQTTEAERNGRVEIVNHAGPDVRPLGRYHQMVLALVNLIRNAAQANPAGPVTIEISWMRSPLEVEIVVDDNGCGVPPASRDQIFSSGFSTRPGGSGQGLVQVRQAISGMGGRVGCEEAQAGGARFRLTLPLRDDTSKDKVRP